MRSSKFILKKLKILKSTKTFAKVKIRYRKIVYNI